MTRRAGQPWSPRQCMTDMRNAAVAAVHTATASATEALSPRRDVRAGRGVCVSCEAACVAGVWVVDVLARIEPWSMCGARKRRTGGHGRARLTDAGVQCQRYRARRRLSTWDCVAACCTMQTAPKATENYLIVSRPFVAKLKLPSLHYRRSNQRDREDGAVHALRPIESHRASSADAAKPSRAPAAPLDHNG